VIFVLPLIIDFPEIILICKIFITVKLFVESTCALTLKHKLYNLIYFISVDNEEFSYYKVIFCKL